MNWEAAGRLLIILALLALCGVLLVTVDGDVESRVPVWLVALVSGAVGNAVRLQYTAKPKE
jgi:hypothetical protein